MGKKKELREVDASLKQIEELEKTYPTMLHRLKDAFMIKRMLIVNKIGRK